MKLVIIFGGISGERGISINSARSLLDNFSGINIDFVYLNTDKFFYHIPKNHLYSNTPSDFDFKLSDITISKFIDEKSLVNFLKTKDIIFPVVHGLFGEDGQLQNILSKHNIPFVGSKGYSCLQMFDKYRAKQVLENNGFSTIPYCLISDLTIDEKKLSKFYNNSGSQKFVIKPSQSGSSIGVHVVDNYKDLKEKILVELEAHSSILVEEYQDSAVEFSVVVLDCLGEAVSLLPTEIEIIDKVKNPIFDYGCKYLPSNNIRMHNPARFTDEIINNIMLSAENLFSIFDADDFLRLDGWVLQDGSIIFNDFNPISGLEQNSILFQQLALFGISQEYFLAGLISNSLARYNITNNTKKSEKIISNGKKIKVICGGFSTERQVSLLSGMNVFYKLQKYSDFQVEFYVLESIDKIWSVPMSVRLHHTVEEIIENCKSFDLIKRRISKFADGIINKLKSIYIIDSSLMEAKSYQLDRFCYIAKQESAFIFNALHGTFGEDGDFRYILDKWGLKSNGSGVKSSRICMDKYITGEYITDLKLNQIKTANKVLLNVLEHIDKSIEHVHSLYCRLQHQLQCNDLLLKPVSEGCSIGVVKITSSKNLYLYLQAIQYKLSNIMIDGINVILSNNIEQILVEEFILTAKIEINNNNELLFDNTRTNTVELTIGVVERKNKLVALNPSITVAKKQILSLEEKFQGGTGVNITPPPSSIMNKEQIDQVKTAAIIVAKKLGIGQYARLDLFFDISKNLVTIIEVNTLPALTPSTVLYHQALSVDVNWSPSHFLKHIVELSGTIKETVI